MVLQETTKNGHLVSDKLLKRVSLIHTHWPCFVKYPTVFVDVVLIVFALAYLWVSAEGDDLLDADPIGTQSPSLPFSSTPRTGLQRG